MWNRPSTSINRPTCIYILIYRGREGERERKIFAFHYCSLQTFSSKFKFNPLFPPLKKHLDSFFSTGIFSFQVLANMHLNYMSTRTLYPRNLSFFISEMTFVIFYFITLFDKEKWFLRWHLCRWHLCHQQFLITIQKNQQFIIIYKKAFNVFQSFFSDLGIQRANSTC